MPGFYEKGNIVCMIPNVEEYQGSQLHFNVDISLNGQQFTGFPSSFKFYNIQDTSIVPTSGSPQGGLHINARGNAFFDTLQKKVKFGCKFGDRLVPFSIIFTQDRPFLGPEQQELLLRGAAAGLALRRQGAHQRAGPRGHE